MRNLVPALKTAVSTGEHSPLPLETIIPTTESLICFFKDIDVVSLEKWSPSGWENTAVYPEDSGLATALADELGVVAVHYSGNIIEIVDSAVSIVGTVDGGILAAEWSPDHEVLCVVTSGKVLLLSRSFEPINDISLTDADVELSHNVSVGWGKKETQFQGRGARSALRQDPTAQVSPDIGRLCQDDNRKIEISWRADGDFVAITAVAASRRVIRILSRGGELSSVSEPQDYQVGCVAWRPSGAVVATVVNPVEGEQRIQFFERNGLKRHSFELDSHDSILQLGWNADGEILSILYSSGVLELWTTKNYHWYRKQVLYKAVKSTVWHPENPRVLVTITDDMFEVHTFSWGVSSNSRGTVAVIDGTNVKITPFERVQIPPPFSLSTVALPQQANEVTISNTGELRALLADGSVWPNGPQNARHISFDDEELRTTSEPDVVLMKGRLCLRTNGSVYDVVTGHVLAQLGYSCLDFTVVDNQVFGITSNCQLVGPNGEILARLATSVDMTDDILMFTTATKLKFVRPSNLQIPADDEVSEACREIERGSLLVTIVPSQNSVVLQAPRGNLETIYPRILVVGRIRALLSEKKWAEAFELCRTHRVDMNILHDYDPTSFIDGLHDFVVGLGTADKIDLFLGSLKDEDVTRGNYRDTSVEAPNANWDPTGKTNRLCDLLIPKIPKRSVLTALALKNPPELSRALSLCGSDEDAISHLVFLTDANMLYDTALGTYNLELALAVAQHAQRDPKEYLPFLRARDSEDGAKRLFEIDDHLRRYERALQSLVKFESEDQVVKYVDIHDLYSEALKLPLSDKLETRIRYLQAEQWLNQANYAQAGLTFEVLDNKSKAVEAYRLAGLWKRALALNPSAAEEIAEQCSDSKNFGAAAEIYSRLRNYENAIPLFCRASRFDDAILIAVGLEETLETGLRESFGNLQEFLSDCTSQLNSQVRRLRLVREKRAEDQLGHALAATDLADDVSLAPTETTNTNASFFTRYTDKTGGTAQTGASRRTTKNRRRAERKKARGKKGTIYEEDYLVGSVTRLIVRVNETQPELQGLVDAMTRRNMPIYVAQLVQSFDVLTETLKENVDEIFDVKDEDLQRFDDNGELYVLEKPTRPPFPAKLASIF